MRVLALRPSVWRRRANSPILTVPVFSPPAGVLLFFSFSSMLIGENNALHNMKRDRIITAYNRGINLSLQRSNSNYRTAAINYDVKKTSPVPCSFGGVPKTLFWGTAPLAVFRLLNLCLY